MGLTMDKKFRNDITPLDMDSPDFDKDYQEIRAMMEESLPELSSGEDFVRRVNGALEAMEFVLKETRKTKRNTAVISVISGLAGFVCGVVMTLFYPFINSFIQNMFLSIFKLSETIEFVSLLLSYSVIASGCVFVALGTYRLLNFSKISLFSEKAVG